MIKRALLLLILATQLIGCSPFDTDLIVGNWQAIEVLEKGKPIDIMPSEVKFDFDANGNYTFLSTIGYKESGSYSMSGDMLITKDVLNKEALEKNVQILKLTADSLDLKMVSDGKERIVKLLKI